MMFPWIHCFTLPLDQSFPDFQSLKYPEFQINYDVNSNEEFIHFFTQDFVDIVVHILCNTINTVENVGVALARIVLNVHSINDLHF